MPTIDAAHFAELLERGEPLQLTDATIAGSLRLHDKKLWDCQLVRCSFRDAVFAGCDFTGAILIDSRFERCSLTSCCLRKTDLRSAVLSESNFAGSDLTRCDLTSANLRDANLTDCQLDGAWLIDTDLTDAQIERTSFRGARLVRTKLNRAGQLAAGATEGAVIEDVELDLPSGRRQVSGPELWELVSPARGR